MAFDVARDRTVLFGGYGDNGRLDDTWEWDGTSWREIDVAVALRPAGRFKHSMAYDPVARRVVLFGGVDSNDLWEWDGSAWTERAHDGPLGTGLFAFDVAKQQLVVLAYGGDSSGNWYTSGWGKAGWALVDVAPHTSGGSLAVDLQRETLTVFGSRVSGEPSETWERGSGDWVQREVTGPAPRAQHRMTYDVARRRSVVFGGRDSSHSASNETWEWDGAHWLEVPTAGPPARDEHAMAFDSKRGRVVMFGGLSDGLTLFGDTWER